MSTISQPPDLANPAAAGALVAVQTELVALAAKDTELLALEAMGTTGASGALVRAAVTALKADLVTGTVPVAQLPSPSAVAAGMESAAHFNALSALSSHVINFCAPPYYGSGDDRITTTVGTTPVGTAVTLTADIGLSANQGVFIAGAGAAGANYVGTVVSCVGTALVVTPATSTEVAAGAKVQHDSSAATNAAMATAVAEESITIVGDGVTYVNGPWQNAATVASSILALPSVFYGPGMTPCAIRLKGTTPLVVADTGPATGGWRFETESESPYTDGAILAGMCATSAPWGQKTAVFLSLEDVIFRCPSDPNICGVNLKYVGRVQGTQVVSDTGTAAAFPLSHDTFAFQMPSYYCVPQESIFCLTVQGHHKGVLTHERSHISSLYTTSCELPIVVGIGEQFIDHAVVDVCTSGVTGEGHVKIGLLAIDQGDHMIDDAGNLLRGEITYKKGSGTLDVVGGTGLILDDLGNIHSIWVDTSINNGGNGITVSAGSANQGGTMKFSRGTRTAGKCAGAYFETLAASKFLLTLKDNSTDDLGIYDFALSKYVLTIDEATGSLVLAARFQGAKGADVVAANDITLGNGNLFDITGATEVQRILGTGWQAGSEVTLQFDANPNVKHNTAAGGGYYGLQLAGAADFAASAGDTLTLLFDGDWWREKCRAVI